jgi:cytochrome P450
VIDFFSQEMLRNPYPLYEQMRSVNPVLHVAPLDLWMIFDFDGVKRVLVDHEAFSSDLSHAAGRGNPGEWFIFFDPPRHTKLRALISKAFTPRVVANLEPRIRELSRLLLDEKIERGEMDLAVDFSVPLAMRVIAEMIGVPAADWLRYKRWSDAILKIANSISKDEEATQAIQEYRSVTAEMRSWLPELITSRQREAGDDLLSRLVHAEVDGQHLNHEEILGFLQLLLVGGQETTANLINNAILCFLEYPDQLARVRAALELLPSAIEEVLRYRSPLQWMPRVTRSQFETHDQIIPPGKLVLSMIGSANRDCRQFRDGEDFDITRTPNPHLAFGTGIHACLGAPLARLEARIALADLLDRAEAFQLASDEPWTPQKAKHVHGPSSLRISYAPRRRAGT